MDDKASEPHALPYRRCVSADIFKASGEIPDGFIADSDAYLAAFVAPVKGEDGKPACFHCGKPIDAFKQAFGTGVAYKWGIAHGEAQCSGCGWPARGMHYPKGRDGKELFSLRNAFLAYHPDEVSVAEDADPFAYQARVIAAMCADIRDTKATGFPRMEALRAVSIATSGKREGERG